MRRLEVTTLILAVAMAISTPTAILFVGTSYHKLSVVCIIVTVLAGAVCVWTSTRIHSQDLQAWREGRGPYPG